MQIQINDNYVGKELRMQDEIDQINKDIERRQKHEEEQELHKIKEKFSLQFKGGHAGDKKRSEARL